MWHWNDIVHDMYMYMYMQGSIQVSETMLHHLVGPSQPKFRRWKKSGSRGIFTSENGHVSLNKKNKGMQTQQVPEGMVPVQIVGYAHPRKTHSSVGYTYSFFFCC